MIATALVVSLALSQARPQTVDISAIKASLKALSDGQGHYLVYDSTKPFDRMFYGDEKKLVELRVRGGGMNGDESWSASLWDPRLPGLDGHGVSILMGEGGKRYELECGKRKTPLTAVPPEALAKLLDTAAFVPASWSRMPERLLRDDRGNYYFVDRLRTDDRLDRRDFRLFVGPRGRMKLLPLKDIVDDTRGMVFSTKTGTLRLVVNVGEAPGGDRERLVWFDGNTKHHLTEVPLDEPINARLVYMDLGPYNGERLGTPCDDWM